MPWDFSKFNTEQIVADANRYYEQITDPTEVVRAMMLDAMNQRLGKRKINRMTNEAYARISDAIEGVREAVNLGNANTYEVQVRVGDLALLYNTSLATNYDLARVMFEAMVIELERRGVQWAPPGETPDPTPAREAQQRELGMDTVLDAIEKLDAEFERRAQKANEPVAA